jgi:hypothetical protein
MAALPPGVTAESFAAAIKQFQAAIGVDWVMTSDEELFPYRDPFSLLHDLPNELLPGAAVGPDSVAQVQAVVRIANQYKIPLYAVSTGKNYAYGAASPSRPLRRQLRRRGRVAEWRAHAYRHGRAARFAVLERVQARLRPRSLRVARQPRRRRGAGGKH